MLRPLLLVIDMQNDFLDTWPEATRERLLQSVCELVSSMRTHECPVVWVRQEFEPDLRDAFLAMRRDKTSITIRGTRGCEISGQLPVAPSDRVIVKKRFSAFFETGLDEILSQLHPDAVIIAGINTHACIRTTAIDAYQRDWPVIIARDCVGSWDEDHHAITMSYLQREIAQAMTNGEIEASMALRAKEPSRSSAAGPKP